MQKKKKLFTYESESINIKELEEDLSQAEQLIADLKDKIDPGALKAKRRISVASNIFVIAMVFFYQ